MSPPLATSSGLFAQEAVGGVVFGLGLGYLAYWLLKSIDQYQIEVLITLAVVTGGYALAGALHLSGPIAVVVAGLMVGNQGRVLAMSDKTREHLDTFWELIDEILNAVLFVLIGLEVLVLTFTQHYLLASVLMIPAHSPVSPAGDRATDRAAEPRTIIYARGRVADDVGRVAGRHQRGPGPCHCQPARTATSSWP